MCSRHRPEAGADSEDVEQPEQGLAELPRPTPQMVEDTLKQMFQQITPQELASRTAETLMADSLGRALHAQRGPGLIVDMGKCVRLNSEDQIEEVPYGYDDQQEDGYACDCEDMAIALIETMKAQQAMADVKGQHIIVASSLPGEGSGRSN